MLTDLQRQFHVFQSRQVGDQVVKLKDKSDVIPAVSRQLFGAIFRNILPIHQHFSFGGGIHTSQDIQHRGLAGAAGPHDHHELALLDLKLDAVHSPDLHFAHFIYFRNVLKHYKLIHNKALQRL